MERFENTISKQRKEVKDRMAELFGLLKELTTNRALEKVLIREGAKSPITKNVNSISLTRGEEEKSDKDDVSTGDNIEKTIRLDTEMPVKEAETENGAENRIKNEPIKRDEKEEGVEAPSSQPVEYYLKHKINEKQTNRELYLMRRSLEVPRKFHWMILRGRFNQLSNVSSPLLSKPVEYLLSVFSTWMAFRGNTRDLGSFGEETDEITDLHQNLEEVLLTKRRDGVAGIKRRRPNLSSDGVKDLMTASGRSRKPSFVCIVVDTSRETRVRRKDTIRLPSFVLNGKSPYEMIYKKCPTLSHLRVFGCLCFATIVNNNDKFGSRSEKYVNRHSNKVKNDTANVFQDVNHINFFDLEYPEIPSDDERVDPKLNSDNKSQNASSSSSESSRNSFTIDFLVNFENDADSRCSKLKKIFKQSVFLRNYNDFVVDSKVKSGIEKYVRYSKLNTENYFFVTQLNKNYEPKSFLEASKYPHWTDAMNEEMDCLLRNGTWDIVELPKGRKAIGSKWIFKIKYQYSGEIDRFKARLVAQGFGQKEGIDYEKIFSPVVKMVTARCLLNIVVFSSWPVFQLDVNNAFLYGDLDEIVYMKPPEGYFPSGNKVCRLKKSLYGLKQTPRQCNAKLTSTLIENGFIQSKSDYSLYTKSDKGVFLALLVYVDDIIITGINVSKIEKFKNTDKGIYLNQRKYVLDLLSEYGMLTCKPVNTLLISKLVISNKATKKDHVLDNITDYQKLMGKLIYLSNTRPDISYVDWAFIIKNSGMSLSSFSDVDWAKCVVTRKSVTDILTKGLDTVQHNELVKNLGMYNVYQVETKRGCLEIALGPNLKKSKNEGPILPLLESKSSQAPIKGGLTPRPVSTSMKAKQKNHVLLNVKQQGSKQGMYEGETILEARVGETYVDQAHLEDMLIENPEHNGVRSGRHQN
ncbi:ribonuclease H-like domain-containing protein [Tanacetum coccineum]